MKRSIVAGILLLLLLCSSFSVPVLAEELPEEIPQIYLHSDKSSAKEGETFTLTLGLDKAMNDIGAFSVKLWFDAASVELVDSKKGNSSPYARLGARAKEEEGRSRWMVNVFHEGLPFSMEGTDIYELSFCALTDLPENLMELFILTIVTVKSKDSDPVNVRVSEPPEEIIITLGDVNGDGVINTADALRILRFYNEEIDLNDSEQMAADVNKDTEINTADALRILRYYNEEILSLEF